MYRLFDRKRSVSKSKHPKPFARRPSLELLEDRTLPSSFGVTELRVNTTTDGNQDTPHVAAAPGGNYVVVWQSQGQDGDGRGVYAQRFNQFGQPLDSEFRVNTTTTGNQINPRVAVAADGSFVVAWAGRGTGDDVGIFAQRFNASGTALGPEFKVNTFTDGNQLQPQVAVGADGRFVIIWESFGQDAPGSLGIYGQRYNPDGTPHQDGEFRVNTTTDGHQQGAAVAMNASGAFVVAWTGQDSDNSAVIVQRFNASGVAQGGEIRANTTTTGNQLSGSVALADNGNFVVTWYGNGPVVS